MSAYDDIISRPYTGGRRRMPQLDRAAQFAPFAALNGHGEALTETARLTEDPIELMEEGIMMLNRKLTALEPGQQVTVVYFQPDSRKSGGSYLRHRGCVKRVMDPLLLTDGTAIPLERICDIII